jgi:hypothetical protein
MRCGPVCWQWRPHYVFWSSGIKRIQPSSDRPRSRLIRNNRSTELKVDVAAFADAKGLPAAIGRTFGPPAALRLSFALTFRKWKLKNGPFSFPVSLLSIAIPA